MSLVRIARDGETLDEICFAHYGRTDQVTEAVLEVNPELRETGPVLAAGTKILLPEISPPTAKETLVLWEAP
jgi:phage tail protein X